MSRVLVWYSDGGASAVAAYFAVRDYGERCEVVKCDTTADEHPDNLRFRREVEAWIGRKVTLIRSDKYAGIDDVFERTRYMAGNAFEAQRVRPKPNPAQPKGRRQWLTERARRT